MILSQQPLDQERFPDYLTHFGLSADPFDLENTPYFQFGKRRQTLSQLLHLCQFSSGLLMVIGEAGVGKSCLKQAVLDHLDQQDIVCTVTIPMLTDRETVLKDIVQKLKIALPERAGDQASGEDVLHAESILSYVRSAQTKDQLKVLVVEDAHNLDDATLQTLIELSQPDVQSHRQLHMVLFGEPQLSQRVRGYESASFIIKEFQIEPFDKEELKAYLRFRLQSVGFEGIFPFKDEDLQFLWDISHGLPSAVHDAAREILIELATPPPESKSMGLPAGHMALLIGLAAVLLVAIFYKSGEAELSPEISEEMVVGKQGVSAEIQNSTAGVVASQEEPAAQQVLAKNISDNERMLEMPASKGEEGKEEVGRVTPPALKQSDKTVESTENKSEYIRAADSLVSPANEDSEDKSLIKFSEVDSAQAFESKARAELAGLVQNSATEKQQLQSPPSKSGITPNPVQLNQSLTADEQRLLSFVSENFTLQVLSGGSEEAVKEYMKRQSNQADLAMFSTKRDGSAVYIVVAGRFESSQAARNAVSDLPQEQQRAGPWPRTFKSVQADILSNR